MKTEKLRRWFFRTDKHANNHVNNKVLVDCTNYQSCANVPSAIYQTKKKTKCICTNVSNNKRYHAQKQNWFHPASVICCLGWNMQ